MNDYANYYRIGALKQGGGSPIRDRNGLIVAQHIPFSSQSQQNGGIEALAPPQYLEKQDSAAIAVVDQGQTHNFENTFGGVDP